MKKSTVSFGFYEREKGEKKEKMKRRKMLTLLDATEDQVSKKIHVPA
jgi:hypothetical protein